MNKSREQHSRFRKKFRFVDSKVQFFRACFVLLSLLLSSNEEITLRIGILFLMAVWSLVALVSHLKYLPYAELQFNCIKSGEFSFVSWFCFCSLVNSLSGGSSVIVGVIGLCFSPVCVFAALRLCHSLFRHQRIDPEESFLVDSSLNRAEDHIKVFVDDPIIQAWCSRNSLKSEKCARLVYSGEDSVDEFIDAIGWRTDLEAVMIKGPKLNLRSENDVVSPTSLLSLHRVFERNHDLRAFLINGNVIDYERATIVVNMLKQAAEIEFLDFFDNCINDETAFFVIREVLWMKRLREVNLGENLVTAEARELLIKLIHASKSNVKIIF
eukprot:TRINITY_DN261_c0_g2_i1.p1 TRINITY_DN261_c0_g2~~TRINITY_DN261_c0_g2_i1.p1  ORF type:complete len:326 (-),score=68.67 TRINITY_DN261_c0_g2_i1:1282-2259(-)